MVPFIEWNKLQRGTYTTKIGYKRLDVWPFMRPGGIAWKWTISDTSESGFPFLDCGEESTLDLACEKSIYHAENQEANNANR